jgi:ABC-type microcin C transport system duplicated ATPase subunit YejF
MVGARMTGKGPASAAAGKADAILSLRDLRVDFRTAEGGEIEAVGGIDLDVMAGEAVALVGESGSGKSQAMLAVMGLLAANGRARGSARYRGTELLGLKRAELDRIRGRRVTMIFQEPMTSLDPFLTIGRQIAEPIVHHGGGSFGAVRSRVVELLDLVGIAEAERRAKAYPHELSGGQRQRVMIAMALANDPDLLVADEPTTALDVTVQAQILDLLRSLQSRLGMAVLLITHDLGIVRTFASRVAVMRRGLIVEEGPIREVFGAPAHAYTQMLLASEPHGEKPPPAAGAPVVLEGSGIRVDYRLRGGFLEHAKTFTAVAGATIRLRRGETIGIVGESGSGKSTLGRALLRLVPSEGRFTFAGQDISTASRARMRPFRRALQIVFQDPFGSLSPRLTVGEIVTEGLIVHEPVLTAAQRDARAASALAEVGLDPSARNRYPHEFSGGQRQRIAIARAVILKPSVIVLDEPTSALDRSVQAQVVALLRRLQDEHGLSYVFISHDLAIVRAMSDYVIVMKDGRIVEEGPAHALFSAPREAYTRTLLAAALHGRG